MVKCKISYTKKMSDCSILIFMNKAASKLEAKETGILYRLTLLAAVVQPLMTLPQAVQLYTTHDAQGLSLATWLGYTTFGLIFLAYSIQFRLVPIIIQQSLWFILQSSVVVGIIVWQ